MFKKITLFSFNLSFYVFFASFFLVLGSDAPEQIQFRLGLGAFILILNLIACFLCKEVRPKWSLPTFLFLFFVLFEITRLVLGQMQGQGVPLDSYKAGALRWVVYFLAFTLAYNVVRMRDVANRLLVVMAFSGFFLAINGIPGILIPETGSPMNDSGIEGFFRSFFYFSPWVPQYLLGRFAHPNYIGDVMAFGFFPALALMFYAYYVLKEKYGRMRNFDWSHPSANALLLYLSFLLTLAMAILLFFSRGTILCFFIAFLFFLFMIFLRRPSLGLVKFVGVFLLIGGIFLANIGNLGQTLEEMQTLKSETKDTSLGTTLEGMTKARRMYQDHALWGVGTDRYADLAPQYRSQGLRKKHELSDFEAMCHYAHLLAEEGAGAYLYFLFILVYLFQVFKGIWSVKSRFQFLAALAFLSPVIMVLGHGAFNHLLQRFSMSMLLYLSMGASLRVLSRDFRSE